MLTDADRLELDLIRFRHARRVLWMILNSNGGYTLEKDDLEDYPGDDVASIEHVKDQITGAITYRAMRAPLLVEDLAP